ncbi:MAG TPA: hypothetical protein VEZ59_08485, partial [Sphingopyxis sp.]|nr:hypothetical protein [Sphingopyxis sp.]
MGHPQPLYREIRGKGGPRRSDPDHHFSEVPPRGEVGKGIARVIETENTVDHGLEMVRGAVDEASKIGARPDRNAADPARRP